MALILDGTNTPTLGGVGYGDGTELAFTGAGTAGGVLYSAGGAAPVFSAAGTSGQVLTSGGAGAPTWAAPATSGLVFISSQTVSTSVASVDFTSGITSTYDNYKIVFSNFRVSAGAGRIVMRLYSGGAWATGYMNAGVFGQAGNVVGSLVVNNNGFIGANGGGTPNTATVWSGALVLSSVNTVTSYASAVNGTISGLGNTEASTTNFTIGGTKTSSGTVTGFQLYFDTGNIVSGTVSLYGMAKS